MSPKSRLWLVAGRLALAALFVLALVMLAVNLPLRFTELSTVCTAAECGDNQLRPADAAQLERLGLPIAAYAVFTLGTYLILTGVSWTLAAVLAWRRSDEPVAILAALTLVAQGGSAGLSSSTAAGIWTLVLTLLLLVWFLGLVNLLYIFPDGRFVPHWTRWAIVPWLAWLAAAVAWVLVTTTNPPPAYWLNLVILTVAVFGLGGLAQIYRFNRVSTGPQRQQTKWVAAGFVVLVATEVIWTGYAQVVAPLLGWATPAGLAVEVASTVVDAGSQMLVPLTIGAAILRFRLWDIDLVIRRTLVYSVLTALLTGAYFASVVVLQAGTNLLTGRQGSALVTVVSTLLIAALFSPLRAGVQAFIDRRFFRRRYDAARTLAEFGANLRDDVDLEHLRETLLGAVVENMQPEHVGLWIRRTSK